MKVPPAQDQGEDLRFVSAYSVYNGLAPGLKSYQDNSESGQTKKKARKKKRIGLSKSENNEDVKGEISPTPTKQQLNINGAVVNGSTKSSKDKRNAPTKSNMETTTAGENTTSTEPSPSKKKKRKKNKKSGQSLVDDDGPSPSKVSKTMSNMVPNPFAAGRANETSVLATPNEKSKPSGIQSTKTVVSDKKSNKKEKKQKKNKSKADDKATVGNNLNNLGKKCDAKTALKSKASKSNVSTQLVNGSGRIEKSLPCRFESKVPPIDIKKIFSNKRIEDSVEHGKSVLEWLIHPVSVDEFMKKYWEKKPLLIKRKHDESENYFKWILSTQSFDDIIRRNVIKYGINLDVTSYENGIRETISENLQGRVRPAVIWDYYNNGCSVRMLNPQTYAQNLWRVNSSLQEWFGSFVGANVYLTPPNSQGFAPHYDDIEAFILQVEGKKQWKVYAPRNDSEKLPRFSSPNFSEDKDDLGEPLIDEVLEEGDLLYFPRGWIHQAKTVDGEHSFHITISCHQQNTYGDLIKHHLNHTLEKLMATDVNFRQGLPADYLSFMGIAHQNTEDPELNRKREIFSSKVKTMISKIADEVPDFAADAMGKKFIWDSLPPFYNRKERETCILDDGEFMLEGRVLNRVEFGPETEVKLTRKNCVRLVVEEGSLRLYYSTDNSMVYHDQDAQYLEIGLEFAPAINHLINEYPNFVKVEDLPIASNDIGEKTQIVGDLWERGLIFTSEPLEPCDDVGLEDASDDDKEDEDGEDEDVESINLSDLPAEDEMDDLSDEFYDTSLNFDSDSEDSDSQNDRNSDSDVDDGQADLGDTFDWADVEEDGEEEQLDGDYWGNQFSESMSSEDEED